jgi:two-component system chemotaxis sensor kinase CheA
MKLQDSHGVVTQLIEFLKGMPEPNAAAARVLKGLFEELSEALSAENRDQDVTKVRKASVFCELIADGSLDDAASEWEWIQTTAQAVAKVVNEGADFADAGYPETVASNGASDFGSLVDADIYAEFISRQSEAIEEVELVSMEIEAGRLPKDISAIMRLFHTLKGESALLGLEDMSRLSHMTEDMLTSEPIADCAERLFLVKDWLCHEFLHLTGDGDAPEAVDQVIAKLLIKPIQSTAEEAPVETTATPETSWEDVGISESLFEHNLLEGDVDLLQDFIGEAGEHLDEAEAQLLVLESEPTESDALNAVFRAFHTIKGVAGFIDMTHIQGLAHKAENLLDMARKGEIELTGEAMDLTFESIDMLKKVNEDIINGLSGDGSLNRREELPALMGRLMACADNGAGVAAKSAKVAKPVEVKNVEEPSPVIEPKAETPATPAPEKKAQSSGFIALKKPKKLAATAAAVVKSPVADTKPAAKPAADAKPSSTPQPHAKVQRKEAVRVDSDRLDLLVETIGELVIAEAMVSQSDELRSAASVEMARNLDHLDKICRELQEIGMSLRMVPVRPIFQKMARLVRDLSKKFDRKIDFDIDGEETELDKSVVDKIGDPLVHMIRNAVDHGIESNPGEREAAGKPEAGRIQLKAFHKGGNIVIEVVDDGKGLDRDVIMAKAMERGLIKEGQIMTDREVFSLIFEPGFSTAKKVTDVSGRGVGMDVVRRNIDELRGTVEIDSEKGKGSIFRFKLPLTLAIIDGMVIKTGAENYIIPTLTVVRLVRPSSDDYSTVREKGEMLRFEEDLIPLFRLNRMFKVKEACDDLTKAVVVVVESDGRKIGLMTDNLVGQQQIVIKSLGEQVQGTPGIAGGAIMSNGNVALILDIAGLVKIAHVEGTTRGMDRAAN